MLWFCSYPVSRLDPLPVKHLSFRREHPSPWTVNLSEAVVANYPDVELHIAVMTAAVKRSFSMQRNGIMYHIVKSQINLPFGRRWPPFEWNVLTGYRSYRARLCKIAATVKPDIILAFGTEDTYAVAAKDSGKPYLIYLQGILHELTKTVPANRKISIRLPLEKEAFEHCRYYVAETEFAAEYVQKTVTSPVIWRMANSVTDIFFKVPGKTEVYNRLLFVGSLIPTKGIRELLEAADKNGWPVTVVGQNEGEYPQMLIKKYQHNPDIRWAGRIPTEEISQLMAVHDALVLPSYMDTSPNVVAEAMAAGLPVVATRVGGIPDMVTDGETGILIEPKSVESLAQGIYRLYADPEKMLEMGAAAKRIALERFRTERNTRILVEACRQILTEQSGNLLQPLAPAFVSTTARQA